MKIVWRVAKTVLGLCSALFLIACGMHVANSGRATLTDRPPEMLRVATHNVHYILFNKAEGPWSMADWDARKSALSQQFGALDADIIAFQEMETFAGGDNDDVNLARSHLLAEHPGYAAAAVGDWRSFPSTQPIFYRKDRFSPKDQGWFFFSDTPDVIYSRTFNGSWPAFASWARFDDRRTGLHFVVVNVHFEYKSRSNRLKSAVLVRDRIARIAGQDETLVLLGDLNDLSGSKTMDILSEAGLSFLDPSGATYHLNSGVNVFPAIDHIALRGAVRSTGPVMVDRRKWGGKWPSDHYPVVADLVVRR